MNSHIIKLYQSNNPTVFNPNKSYSVEDIQEAFSDKSTLFNSIEDGISIQNTDLKVDGVNFTLRSWFPERKSFIGKKCYYVYHNRTKPCEHCPVLKTIEDGTAHRDIVSFEIAESHLEGWHELQSYPILENGKVVGVIEYVKDITSALGLYSKIEGIENKMGHFKEQNELLKQHLDSRDSEKTTITNDINLNIRRYVKPLIKQIKDICDERPIEYDLISFLETMLQDIVNPYLGNAALLDDFTSREIQIMSLIRSGKATKEIASVMCVSSKTIDFHRANIRKKFKLDRSDCLRTHIMRANIPLD